MTYKDRILYYQSRARHQLEEKITWLFSDYSVAIK